MTPEIRSGVVGMCERVYATVPVSLSVCMNVCSLSMACRSRPGAHTHRQMVPGKSSLLSGVQQIKLQMLDAALCKQNKSKQEKNATCMHSVCTPIQMTRHRVTDNLRWLLYPHILPLNALVSLSLSSSESKVIVKLIEIWMNATSACAHT